MSSDDPPAALSSVLSVSMAVAGAGASGLFVGVSFVTAFGGVLLVLSGLAIGRREPITLGAAGIFLAALLAGWAGAGLAPTVLSVTAAILAWDFGQFGIGVGEQLGSDARTVRLELAHAVASTAVGVCAILAGMVAFALAGGTTPASALFVLVTAVAVVVIGLRRMGPLDAVAG